MGMIDPVECRRQVGVEHPTAARVWTPGHMEDGLDGVMAATTGPKPIGLRLEACLPLGFQCI